MKATPELPSDKAVMEQLRKRGDDIKCGRIKDWDDFIKELAISKNS